MPQFTIKLNTYDPVIVEALDRLRKSRKQAAFTQEALKHFLATEKGEQMIDLMNCIFPSHMRTSANSNIIEQPQEAIPLANISSEEPQSRLSQNLNSCILGKILE